MVAHTPTLTNHNKTAIKQHKYMHIRLPFRWHFDEKSTRIDTILYFVSFNFVSFHFSISIDSVEFLFSVRARHSHKSCADFFLPSLETFIFFIIAVSLSDQFYSLLLNKSNRFSIKPHW